MARTNSHAGSVVQQLNDLRRENRQLRQQRTDLRWECRALRVQLYAHETYAKRYQEMHGEKSS